MNKKKLITAVLVTAALAVLAGGLYLAGSSLVQMIQAHLGG